MSLINLKSLSMAKYERLLPRVFPGSVNIEIRDRHGALFWCLNPGEPDDQQSTEESPVVSWSEFGGGIARREMPCGRHQYRMPVLTLESGESAQLIVSYDTQIAVPMGTAPEPLHRAFTDATAFLREELELQSECNQLAVELSERYEELNLMYSTKDQVEYFEEGQEALVRLVHNCADYLDVGLAALICRDRGLTLHNANSSESTADVETIIELLSTTVYNRVESQVRSIVLNESDEDERERLFAGRAENVLANPIVDDHGTAIGILAVVARRDIHTFSNGDRNLLEVMAKKASRIIHTHHDSLTGLMNRSGFESSLVTALASTHSKNLQHCLLHIDIDQLHVVNDLMGHQEGDNLIRRAARMLRGILRESDYLARLGGDEFGALLSNCDTRQGHAVADKIRNSIRELSVISANKQLAVTASIGVAGMTHEAEGIVGVMASAEIACKTAKENGRDRIEVFEKGNSMLVRRSEEVEWIGRVQEALRDDLFALYCQVVLPLLDNGQPPHHEILVRMIGNDGEILSPISFMPAAERYQLMPMLDRWVVHNSLKDLGSCWKSIEATDAVFCINLSGQSLTNIGFLAFITDEIEAAGVPAKNICFEITETAAISNIDEAMVFMDSLKAVGCRFALDDFGAGLSSFGYLKTLPVDYLKIDGSFVSEIVTDKISRSMVDAICQIGKTMGLAMIAEYVGDTETMDILRKIGVDYGQGFHLGRPVPLKEVTDRLQDRSDVASA